ncbi:unnamed protein product [Clavelina lepadiformis]|uniref:Methyltransferase type 11 domain-containing protein n=1 Tax=Clavelina lepadiformis TaxID=159417 RepID=A0ABP0FKL5_CLALP
MKPVVNMPRKYPQFWMWEQVRQIYDSFLFYIKFVVLKELFIGTGRLGGHLRNHHGYEGTLDILDANMDLLMQAEKKDLNIRNIIRHAITESGELPVQDESYDMITCIGAFLPNNIPATALPGIIKAVKRGGLIVVEMRKTTIDAYRAIFDANLQMLLDQSELRKVYEEDYIPYKNFDTSPIFTAFVFKRL